MQLREGSDPSDEELLATCQQHVARYKLPKAIIRTGKVRRSPAGKADYRWAKEIAVESLSSTAGSGS
ncbi:AMP-dependent synthetase and ligase [Mycobacterium tuberculosis]|nr:AMP-dependent synthetase and ligase [Mycobacterium tuberculosis]